MMVTIMGHLSQMKAGSIQEDKIFHNKCTGVAAVGGGGGGGGGGWRGVRTHSQVRELGQDGGWRWRQRLIRRRRWLRRFWVLVYQHQ
jgi:hypothetical protein